MTQKIFLAADHGGWQIKEEIKQLLAVKLTDSEIVDCGADSLQPDDDYPLIIKKMIGQLQQADLARDKGIIFCRSGTGVTIVANKFKKIRAGNCFNPKHVKLAVAHNQINVLAIPADFIENTTIMEMIEMFLQTQPDPAPRHWRRVEEINEIENENLC